MTNTERLERIGSFGYGVYRVLGGQLAVADPDGGLDGYFLIVPTVEVAYEEMESAGLLDADP